MKYPIKPAALSFLLLLSPLGSAQTRSHNLTGDIRIQVSSHRAALPKSLSVVLRTTRATVISRQQVAPNGRYRFVDVADGEYELVVEGERGEVARVYLLVNTSDAKEIHNDVALVWQAVPAGQGAALPDTVDVTDFYRRIPARAAQFEKAMQAAACGDYSRGSALLSRLVAEDPHDFIAWCRLGSLQVLQGNLADAEKSYLRSIETKADYFHAFLVLGRLRMALRSYEDAIRVLSRAVKLRPRSADANRLLGESYLQMRKGSRAVVYLNEAIRLDPLRMAEVHLRLAALYDAAQLRDKAAAEYEQFLLKRPEYPDKKQLEEYIRQNRRS